MIESGVAEDEALDFIALRAEQFAAWRPTFLVELRTTVLAAVASGELVDDDSSR